MQFKVPQFIDIEDKLFGPFTFRQFAYLAGGGGIVFVTYRLLPLWIGIFIIIPVGSLALLLTFYPVNGRPFIYTLESGLAYLMRGKLYIWKQRLKHREDKKEEDMPKQVSVTPELSASKLRDISWSLDVLDKK